MNAAENRQGDNRTLCIYGPPVAGTDFGAAERTHAQRGQVGQWQYRLRSSVGVARATKRKGRGRVSAERTGAAQIVVKQGALCRA